MTRNGPGDDDHGEPPNGINRTAILNCFNPLQYRMTAVYPARSMGEIFAVSRKLAFPIDRL